MSEQENEEVSLSDCLQQVETRIQEACRRAGRDRGEVTLLAVSKGHGPGRIHEAVAAGIHEFGESKVQEARAKIPQSPSSARWHLIGHLQSNKVKLAVELFPVIHSVDSLKILNGLNEAATAQGVVREVFLEVNVSGELSKYGLVPDAVREVLDAATHCMALDVVGLMTIPPFTEDPEGARPHFRALRELRDRVSQDTGFPLEQLSMGMSHDLEIAIEEGATCVRVGTDLFGARKPPSR